MEMKMIVLMFILVAAAMAGGSDYYKYRYDYNDYYHYPSRYNRYYSD